MTKSEIMSVLQEVFRDVFRDDALVVKYTTNAEDVAAWDSLSNIQMILAVEQAFRIRLTASQVSALQEVGDLISLIETKISSRAA